MQRSYRGQQQYGRRTISVHNVSGMEVQQPRARVDGLQQGARGLLSWRGPCTAPASPAICQRNEKLARCTPDSALAGPAAPA